MKKKIVKKITYTGLGFPIELHNVEMLMFEDEWHPKVDVKKVALDTVKSLISQKERLTGNQIRFIRSYFSMSLREFAKNVVHESHMAVSKWEKFGDKPSNMDVNIEMMLRLYICEQLGTKTTKQKGEFYKRYLEIRKIFLLNSKPAYTT